MPTIFVTFLKDFFQKAGTARPSFVASNLEAMYGEEPDPEQQRAIKLASAMMFIGEWTPRA